MTTPEPLVNQHQLRGWGPSVPSTQRFRNVLVRDRVSAVVGPPPAGPGGSPDAAGRLAAVEVLVAEDMQMWQRRAVDDHGVTDPSHVREHAEIIRNGSSCMCPPGASTGAIQRDYLQSDYDRATELGLALLEARRAVEEGASP